MWFYRSWARKSEYGDSGLLAPVWWKSQTGVWWSYWGMYYVPWFGRIYINITTGRTASSKYQGNAGLEVDTWRVNKLQQKEKKKNSRCIPGSSWCRCNEYQQGDEDRSCSLYCLVIENPTPKNFFRIPWTWGWLRQWQRRLQRWRKMWVCEREVNSQILNTPFLLSPVSLMSRSCDWLEKKMTDRRMTGENFFPEDFSSIWWIKLNTIIKVSFFMDRRKPTEVERRWRWIIYTLCTRIFSPVIINTLYYCINFILLNNLRAFGRRKIFYNRPLEFSGLSGNYYWLTSHQMDTISSGKNRMSGFSSWILFTDCHDLWEQMSKHQTDPLDREVAQVVAVFIVDVAREWGVS